MMSSPRITALIVAALAVVTRPGWCAPGVTSFDTRSGSVTLNSTDVKSALGFTPANSANVINSFNSRTGAVTLNKTDVVGALGYTPASSTSVVSSFNNRTGAVTLNSTDVTGALGFTPANSANVVTSVDNRTGAITLTTADVTGALGYTPANAASSVTSFNTRSGAITLTGADVTGALGFTPANSANVLTSFNSRTGAVTLSSADVTGALGYTPANAATGVASFDNRTGAITLTGADVTGALGYTPANSANIVTSVDGQTGAVTLGSADVTGALGFTPANSANVLTSFNSRTGAVTLTGADVTGALGYTPANAASGVSSFNGRTNAVTLTGSDVTTALGYNPANPAASTTYTASQFFPAINGGAININENGNPGISIGQPGQYEPAIRFSNPTSLAPFNIEVGGSNFNGIFDDVLYWGYNMQSAGSKINPNAAALGFGLESNYNWNNTNWMEWNLNFESPSNSFNTRPLYFFIDRDAPDVYHQQSAWKLSIGDLGSSEFEILGPDGNQQKFMINGLDNAMNLWSASQQSLLRTTITSDAVTGRAVFQMFSPGLTRSSYLFYSGNVGIATDPAADAALDIDGGGTKGLRLRPATFTGAPTTGQWSSGTIIMDATGTLYICAKGGAPGTWKQVLSQ